MSMLGIESRNPGSSYEVNHGAASTTFVVATVLIVTFAFLLPIKRSWTISRDANYETVFVDYGQTHETGEAWARPAALAMLGMFGILAIFCPGGNRMQWLNPLAILWIAFFAWCGATCLWADDWMFALTRFIANMCGVVAAFAIAKRASPRQFVWIVFACTLSWLTLGLLAELSLGTFRPWEGDHRFAGIFHPNGMGTVCAILVLAALYLARCEPRYQRWLWVAAAVGFVFLYLTRSRTALITTMLVIAVAELFVASAKRRVLSVMAVAGAAALLGLLIGSEVINVSTNADELGRGARDVSSFTRRMWLWEDLLPFIAERPMLGYSYSFWAHDLDLTEPAQSAHSLYFDAVLAFGFIGAVLYVSGTLFALLRSVLMVVRWPQCECGFFALLVMYLMMCGVVETTLWFTEVFGFFTISGICFLAFRNNLVPTGTQRAALPQYAVQPLVSQWRLDYLPEGIDV